MMGAAAQQQTVGAQVVSGSPPPSPSLSPTPDHAQPSPARREIIAVGGGKGGIGKSLIAANMGVHLAQRGCRVVLVDADLGGANLRSCLGMTPPERSLSDFITRKQEQLDDVISSTPVAGLGLISGAMDLLGAANPKYTQKLRLLRAIARLDVDYVIIDLGGGTGFNILDFFLIADHGVLAVMPEPTSIENAYRFIKSAYYRRLKTTELSAHIRPLLEEAMAERGRPGLKTPAELTEYVVTRDPDAGAVLRDELSRLPLKLVVNQARTREELELGRAIGDACRKYFGMTMDFVGAIPYDESVWKAVRQRQPVMLANPEAAASRAIRQVTAELGLEV